MKLSEIKNKKIVNIRQTRRPTRTGHNKAFVWDIDAIVLENGWELRPVVGETDFGEYTVQIVIHKPNPRSIIFKETD